MRNGGRDAIEQQIASRFLPAIHDEAIGGECVGDAGHLAHQKNSRDQSGKIQNIPAIQRKIDDAFILNHRAQGGSRRFDQLRFRGDLHVFSHRAQFH